MSETIKAMTALAQLADVHAAAQRLADLGVLRQEDVTKCCRVFTKKHPEIQAAITRAYPDPPQELPKPEGCAHEWPEQPKDEDRCPKCGMAFIAHVFMEMP